MPVIQSVDESGRNPDPSGVQNFFSRLSASYKEKQDNDVIGGILKEYDENRNQAQAWEHAYNKVQRSNASPSRKLQEMKSLQEEKKILIDEDKALNAKYKQVHDETKAAEKEKKDITEKKRVEELKTQKETEVRDRHQASIKQQYLDAGVDEATAERDSKVDSATTAASKVRELNKKNNPKNEDTLKKKFEEGLATQASKEVPELEREIKKISDLLANVDTAEKLANEQLGGLIGYGKAILNTESASKLETLGATNLGSVIKLFNPAGTLPTAKLNWIKKTFAVSPYDTLSEMKGKFDTQRIILNQGRARAQERVGLLKKYYGNIPEEVTDQFDKDTGDLLDALEEELEPSKKNDPHKGMVQVPDPKGELRWVPKEVAEQMKRKK